MSLLRSAPTSCTNSYRLSYLEIKASKIHKGRGREGRLPPGLLLATSLSTTPASQSLASIPCSGFQDTKLKTWLFTFFFFFLRETLSKIHSLEQKKQLNIQIQGCPTLITVHRGSISCLYIELMRIHHPCQIY